MTNRSHNTPASHVLPHPHELRHTPCSTTQISNIPGALPNQLTPATPAAQHTTHRGTKRQRIRGQGQMGKGGTWDERDEVGNRPYAARTRQRGLDSDLVIRNRKRRRGVYPASQPCLSSDTTRRTTPRPRTPTTAQLGCTTTASPGNTTTRQGLLYTQLEIGGYARGDVAAPSPLNLVACEHSNTSKATHREMTRACMMRPYSRRLARAAAHLEDTPTRQEWPYAHTSTGDYIPYEVIKAAQDALTTPV
ncbi:hypothetical protein BDV93DRAFT_508301 [Ceratobasidium sp. AG-I]|nr:hypothetical protein BDV93DRAFT_508301 [Ceratobasidium sp. AG-I]